MSDASVIALIYSLTILLPINGLIMLHTISLLKKKRMVMYNTMILRNEALIARGKKNVKS